MTKDIFLVILGALIGFLLNMIFSKWRSKFDQITREKDNLNEIQGFLIQYIYDIYYKDNYQEYKELNILVSKIVYRTEIHEELCTFLYGSLSLEQKLDKAKQLIKIISEEVKTPNLIKILEKIVIRRKDKKR